MERVVLFYCSNINFQRLLLSTAIIFNVKKITKSASWSNALLFNFSWVTMNISLKKHSSRFLESTSAALKWWLKKIQKSSFKNTHSQQMQNKLYAQRQPQTGVYSLGEKPLAFRHMRHIWANWKQTSSTSQQPLFKKNSKSGRN